MHCISERENVQHPHKQTQLEYFVGNQFHDNFERQFNPLPCGTHCRPEEILTASNVHAHNEASWRKFGILDMLFVRGQVQKLGDCYTNCKHHMVLGAPYLVSLNI